MRLKPKPGDFFIVLFIAAAAVIMMISMRQADTGEKTALIIHDGVVVKKIRLDTLDHTEIHEYSGEYPGVIEAENGRIRFREAECPDQVCVRTGWISKNGQIAVCLPEGILIKITGVDSAEDDTDILLY
ncbi:MAG TPA: NusG domain II-containing protein [Thermoclostridium sp.]|nr:NusG domain II-containing protein [Clostridiaceae bacterium]HOQ76229.1 NusG domain II-containing protein [Thermoclostridium sp.]HPU45124.1 NusG domain II-containing protein [Thermoclostridium sp.]